MNVLVLNCGSSSIKYQLLNMDAVPVVLAKGIVEKIGLTYGSFTYKPEGKDKVVAEQPIMDHSVGMDLILKALVHPDHGVLKSLNEIDAVGHRVAHGGEYFSESVKIDDEAKAKIKALGEIAPLHNPANLKGIETMEKLLPSVPQVAVFDTSFHQTLPKKAFIYGIPYEYYEEYGVRRYGFHGTSHKFVAEKACRILGWDITEKKIITCHLGNGASITAIDKGKSVDTSMGFTPEAGLCGWTDPDNRRGYPWGREDQELIQFHRDVIKVHKDSAALMKGSVMFLHGEYKVVSYGRFLPGEAVVVILNNDYEPHELNLHVRRLGVQDGAVMKACITTTESGYQMDETEYVVANNKLKITVGPISAVVLKYTEPSV